MEHDEYGAREVRRETAHELDECLDSAGGRSDDDDVTLWQWNAPGQ